MPYIAVKLTLCTPFAAKLKYIYIFSSKQTNKHSHAWNGKPWCCANVHKMQSQFSVKWGEESKPLAPLHECWKFMMTASFAEAHSPVDNIVQYVLEIQ